MSGQAADLARRLARHAEAVCRYYLPNGRRCGHYWLVGDVHNTRGRSLYVRLTGPDYGPGAAGKWSDAATGEHGDLLDLIAANRGVGRFRDLSNLSESMTGGHTKPDKPSQDVIDALDRFGIRRGRAPPLDNEPEQARRVKEEREAWDAWKAKRERIDRGADVRAQAPASRRTKGPQ